MSRFLMFSRHHDIDFVPTKWWNQRNPWNPLLLAGFCGAVISIWRPRPFGGLSEWLHFPEPKVNPPAKQTELRVLQRKAQPQRGQEWYLKQCRIIFTYLNINTFQYCSSGTIFTVGDITTPLCRGHRRAICVDGRHGQFYRCGESCQRYHQPDSKYFNDTIDIIVLYWFYSVSTAVVCVSISDWALYSLWIHLWRDAPESQYPDWKTGWINFYWQGQLPTLSCVNSNVLSTCFLFFLSGFLFQHNKLAPAEHAPGRQSRPHLFLQNRLPEAGPDLWTNFLPSS